LLQQAIMKPIIIVLAFVALAGLATAQPRIAPARAYSNSGVEPVRARTCADRYTHLLMNAKAALTTGDRAGAVYLLEQAKHMIPACPSLRDGASQDPVLLSFST
jgi:hypothetical protein